MPPRRAFLAGGGALSLAAVAPLLPPPSPDAALIALCAEMGVLERRVDALFVSLADEAVYDDADAAARVIEVDEWAAFVRCGEQIAAGVPAADAEAAL